MEQPQDILLASGQVRKRYGDCSEMWLYRREHDNSGFPKPLRINGRRFWRLSELLAYERTLQPAA